MVTNVLSGAAAVSSLQQFASTGYGGLYGGDSSNNTYLYSNIQSISQSTLNDYYSTSALRDPSTARMLMESFGVTNGTTPIDPAGTPPWDDPSIAYENYLKSDADKLQDILSRNSLLDEGDELITDDLSQASEAKNLFLLHKASTRLEELSEYLQKGNERDTYRTILAAEFERYMAEFDSLLEEVNFASFNLTRGFDTDSLSTEKLVSSGSVSFYATAIETDYDTDVSGLTGTEKFYVDITKDNTTTSVEVDLSEITAAGDPLSLANIATLMNDKISDAGFGTTFSTENAKDDNGDYTDFRRLSAILGLNETVSFSAEATDRSSAVYVVGSDGYDEYTNGYVTKLSDLTSGTPTQDWRTNIDTSSGLDLKYDDAQAVTTDASGNVYVVGNTYGSVNGQTNNSSTGDAYIAKYDSTGREVWSRLLGADDTTKVKSINVDSNGDIVLTGQTVDQLLETTTGGNIDTFVTKLNGEGLEQWTYQGRVDSNDAGLDVAFDSSGNVYVTGTTTDSVSDSLTHGGGVDAQILKLDGSTGDLSSAFQFGASTGETGSAITVDSDGNMYVAGDTDGTGFLKKYDSSFTLLWEQSLGTVTTGSVKGLAIEGTNVYVGGTANSDGFIAQYDSSGTAGWTQSIAGSGTDTVTGLTVASDAVYVSGSTSSSLDGTSSPTSDAPDSYVSRLDITTGTQDWAYQFGGALETGATGVAVTDYGSSVLNKIGLAEGIELTNVREGISDYVREFDASITTQTAIRPDSSFKIKVGIDGVEETITIESDDTVRWLVFKINEVLGAEGSASVFRKDGGLGLSIQALNGNDIFLSAGSTSGFDALDGLGLSETTIYGKTIDPTTGESISRRGLFALNIAGELTADSDTNAGDSYALLSYASKKFKDAYEYMLDPINYNDDPLAELEALQAQQDQENAVANAPEYLRNQINSYQDALSRISVIQPSQVQGGLFSGLF